MFRTMSTLQLTLNFKPVVVHEQIRFKDNTGKIQYVIIWPPFADFSMESVQQMRATRKIFNNYPHSLHKKSKIKKQTVYSNISH